MAFFSLLRGPTRGLMSILLSYSVTSVGFLFRSVATIEIMAIQQISALLSRPCGGHHSMYFLSLKCTPSSLFVAAIALGSLGLLAAPSTALAQDASIDDGMKHGIRLAHERTLPQGPLPSGPHSGDSIEQQCQAVFGPLRCEPPVPGEMSFGDCSTYRSESRPELDPGIEILRPDERLEDIAALNQPLLDWITNSPAFNVGALMQSLLALLDMLQDLLDARTGGGGED